jgi:hypothetical protein
MYSPSPANAHGAWRDLSSAQIKTADHFTDALLSRQEYP